MKGVLETAGESIPRSPGKTLKTSLTYCISHQEKETTFSSALSLPIKFVLKTKSITALWEEIQFGFLPRQSIVMMLHYHSKAKNKKLNLAEITTNFKRGL